MLFDAIVVGGGSAGAACALAARGLTRAILTPARPAPCVPGSALDARVYAISPGNAEFLQTLGAWQQIPPERLSPVYTMRVFGDDGRSLLEFDAHRSGVPELAWILEDQFLQAALWQALNRDPGVQVFDSETCESIEWAEDRARLRLDSAKIVETRLVIGADGARSRVREQAGIPARGDAYGQCAVVANFACERPHRGVAYQWFREGAVLALLPLPEARVSMVWSAPQAFAEHLLALSPEGLCGEVERASTGVVGALQLVTPPAGYALHRSTARSVVAPRVALIGDAAHVVHPLAGQGANLGLQDAQSLAAALCAREPGRDPGELALLRRYARERAEPVWTMQTVVHGLHRLFGAQGDGLSRLRNLGLRAVDRAAPLKNLLMRRALQHSSADAPMENSR